MTYFASLSGPVAVENYVIVDNNQSLMKTTMRIGLQEIPEFNFSKALLIFTDVELIPPQRPLSDEMVTITFFLTSTPRIATQGKTIRATIN